MSYPLIQPAIDAFLKRAPLRVGSLIVTIFGDAVLPHGKFVRLTSLLEITSIIGIDDGAVRVAIHRLEKDGWLKKSKIGRNAHYALSKTGEKQSHQAAKLIYGFDQQPNTNSLQMLIMTEGPGRAEIREKLLRSGWGQIAANVVLTSGSMEQLDALNELPANNNRYLVPIDTATQDVLRLCSKAWSLESLNDEYERFIQLYRPIAEEAYSGHLYVQSEAMVLRILMIHDYRRLILKDPFLATKYLPDIWFGTQTRGIVSGAYSALKMQTKDWISAGETR